MDTKVGKKTKCEKRAGWKWVGYKICTSSSRKHPEELRSYPLLNLLWLQLLGFHHGLKLVILKRFVFGDSKFILYSLSQLLWIRQHIDSHHTPYTTNLFNLYKVSVSTSSPVWFIFWAVVKSLRYFIPRLDCFVWISYSQSVSRSLAVGFRAPSRGMRRQW